MNTTTTHRNSQHPKSIQKWLNWYAFFLAFPVVEVLGLSITFYIFVFIFFLHNSYGIPFIHKNKSNVVFWLFLFAAVISTIFHPPLIEPIGPFGSARNVIQIAYWLVLALYIKTNYRYIDWVQFSKYTFWGLVLLEIVFYAKLGRFSLIFGNIDLHPSRNSVVFNTLTFFPFIFWYLRNSIMKRITWLIIIFFVASMLFSNGRAGFVLILVQTLLIGPAVFKSLSGLFRLSIVFSIFLVSMWFFLEDSPMMKDIAQVVESVNPRAAELINKSGTSGDLSMDKSWLLRKLMVDKSIEIVNENPFFGIGWFNFSNYGSDLNSLNQFERLSGNSDQFYNTRSAHNSYAQLLAEGGIIGLLLLLIILFPTVKIIISKILTGGFKLEHLPLIAMFTLIIYFYVISSLTGAGTWLIIGASYAFANKH